MNDEPLQVALRVTQTLDDLGVPYLIGGSIASALYGEPRATMDADIVADLHFPRPPHLTLRALPQPIDA
jgi:hypothetical protein